MISIRPVNLSFGMMDPNGRLFSACAEPYEERTKTPDIKDVFEARTEPHGKEKKALLLNIAQNMELFSLKSRAKLTQGIVANIKSADISPEATEILNTLDKNFDLIPSSARFALDNKLDKRRIAFDVVKSSDPDVSEKLSEEITRPLETKNIFDNEAKSADEKKKFLLQKTAENLALFSLTSRTNFVEGILANIGPTDKSPETTKILCTLNKNFDLLPSEDKDVTVDQLIAKNTLSNMIKERHIGFFSKVKSRIF